MFLPEFFQSLNSNGRKEESVEIVCLNLFVLNGGKKKKY